MRPRATLVLLAVLVAGVIGIAWRAGYRWTRRAPRESRSVAVQNHHEEESAVLSPGLAEESLAALLESLREYRRAGERELASALFKQIQAWLGDGAHQSPSILTERHDLLVGGLKARFIGEVCDTVGEAAFYEDVGALAASEMRTSAARRQSGLGVVLDLFERGLPEEHGAYTERDAPGLCHAECVALLPVLAALENAELAEAQARALLASEWTRQCRVIRSHVVAVVAAAWPFLIASIASEWLDAEEDDNLAFALCAALLRDGRVAEAMALIEKNRNGPLLTPLLMAVGSVGTPEEAFVLLGLVRRRLEEVTGYSANYQGAITAGYGELCRRSVLEQGCGVFLERVTAAMETSPEEWTSRGQDAVMGGIADACGRFRVREGRDLFGNAAGDADLAAARLAAIVVRGYTGQDAVISTDGLTALANVCNRGDVVLDAIATVVATGNVAATVDALASLCATKRRGLIDDEASVARAGRTLAALGDRVETFPEQVLYIRAVKEVGSAMNIDSIERLMRRIEARGGGDAERLLKDARDAIAALRQ
jgi:hypothetical protein